jgi:hypothetical protein
MLPALFLSLMPVLVILAFRTLCTLRPAPVPTYWWPDEAINGGSAKGRNGCPLLLIPERP